jgi:formylglycine-generating enzyme required for sulfatase activity
VGEVFPSSAGAVPPVLPPEQSLRAEVVPGGKPKRSGLAVVSLVCGICTLLLFPLFFLFMIPAIVCGHVAQARIKQAKGALMGGGMALAGLIMGYSGIVMVPVVGLVAVTGWTGWYYGIERPAQRRLAEQQRQEEARLAEVARLENARREAEQARRTGVVPASLRRDTTITTDGRSITIPDVNLELLPISAGRFAMGSTNGGSDERPVTQVEITRAFWLGKTEVTQAQWEAVMGSNPSRFKGADRPVEQVSYDDALEFCRKLTARERAAGRLPSGYEYTLPTEAQWEYACRAGTTGDYAGSLDSMGWYGDNSGRQTHSVGQKQANAWGLYDMHGNVWEWCLDWYAGSLPGGTVRDPSGPSSGSFRVIRGGSWNDAASRCRSANRNHFVPGFFNLGFRLALSSAP